MSARGEAILNVNGKEIPILFTNRALLIAEKQIGQPIMGVINAMSNMQISMGDLVALLRAGMEAARVDGRLGGKPYSNENAMDVIEELGLTTVLVPVVEAVSAVISYNGQAEPDNETSPN